MLPLVRGRVDVIASRAYILTRLRVLTRCHVMWIGRLDKEHQGPECCPSEKVLTIFLRVTWLVGRVSAPKHRESIFTIQVSCDEMRER